jgi:hypothetical protein
MSDFVDASQCRAIIEELAAMLPPLFRARAARRIVSFGEVDENPHVRTRWNPVFTGGGIVHMLITDLAAPPASQTKDVDAVIEIASYGDFVEMEEVLRDAGFKQIFTDQAAIVAWYWKGRRIDFLPHRPIHMRANRWFPSVLADAVRMELGNGKCAWIASAPSFLATKFEAFFSRGGGDYLRSKDIEDILAVIDGRDTLLSEIVACSPDVRAFVSKCTSDLLNVRSFMDSLPYLITDNGRETVVIERMQLIARQC